jgi:hypothetical protein
LLWKRNVTNVLQVPQTAGEKRKDHPVVEPALAPKQKKRKKKATYTNSANGVAGQKPRSAKPEKKLYDASGYRKPKGYEAWIWKHFDQHVDHPGWVQCKIPCQGLDGKERPCLEWVEDFENTTNLHQHGKKAQHRKFYDKEAENSKPEDRKTNRGNAGMTMFSSPGMFARFNTLFALWVAANNRPLSVGDDFAFLDMLRCLAPTIDLPSRKALTERIHEFSLELQKKVCRLDCPGVSFACRCEVSSKNNRQCRSRTTSGHRFRVSR